MFCFFFVLFLGGGLKSIRVMLVQSKVAGWGHIRHKTSSGVARPFPGISMFVYCYLRINHDNWRHGCARYSTTMISHLFAMRMCRSINLIKGAGLLTNQHPPFLPLNEL